MNRHGEGIIQIPRNDEITTKREPIIPASEVVNDEMIQAVKKEIGQNLKIKFFKLLEKRILII
uniref:Uncharacterized protein n=1 Tax=Rhizophagus irregularis (strain DAOM 181602 / DAOM 197198 / MUCL 43194) TaxID=747089 RepID=U9STX1_RHIID